jgi:hypothetical protein
MPAGALAGAALVLHVSATAAIGLATGTLALAALVTSALSGERLIDAS